jgi:uncharacterized protein YkwD
MVQKHIAISMIAPVAVAGILIMTLFTATANAQESNNTGNPQQPVAGCGPGTDNSTCSTTPNPQAPAAPTAGCGPGTDNSTCSTTSTPSPSPNQQPPAAPTAGCGPGTDNSTCKTTTPSLQPTNITKPTNNTGNVSADFVNTILQIVNRERASVGVPPLTWSDSLAAASKTWADHLVAINQMVHATNDEKGGPFGETIAGSCGNGCGGFAARVAQMVEGWVSEKASYHGEPINSTNSRIFGHYTQIVWRNEQQIGCGMATAPGQDYLVCRYNLPGNARGLKPY